MKSFGRFCYTSILLVLLAASAWADDPQAQNYPATKPDPQIQQDQADPPGRVARVQYMSGQVSIQPQGTGDWVEGSTNRPLTNGDNVWADKSSRAELNFGVGVMRIDAETSLTMTNINTDVVQVSLHQGALNVSVRQLYGGETYEIDTPNLAFTVKKPGVYRFDVDPNADTTMVTVWSGEGEATGQGAAVQIHSGEQVQFNSGTSLAHETHEAPPPDGFDDWCRLRDQRREHSASARYVNPNVVGSDDLDEYGTWKETPDYGPVWVPSGVAPGWAPYAYGQWAWQYPWGWTWVDAAPWGFAPFHYGRWVWWGGYWGWAPGPYWVRPWYAPALVGWFGPGFGVGFGFGFGWGFGWCPLGWGEPFFPWYHVSPFYFRNVNITNTRIVNINRFSNTYFHNPAGINSFHLANMNRPGGFTAVSKNTLEHGLSVHGNTVKVSPNELKGATALSHVNASPTREAMLGGRSATTARPSGNVASRPTVSRMTPPAVSRSNEAAGNFSRGEEAGARNVGTNARGPENTAGRGVENPAGSKAPETRAGSMNTPAPAGRSVPRPPESFNSGETASRSAESSSAFSHNVPRPPSSAASSSSTRNEPSQMASNRNVPRPPEGSLRSPSESSAARGSSFGGYGSSRSVPRPSGNIQPAPRNYASAGGYSSRSGGGYGSYRGSSNYGSRYGGSYGGGRSYSAPSRSYGGSYHGSSGSHSSSHSSSGSHGGGHR